MAREATALENVMLVTLVKIDHVVFKSKAFSTIFQGKVDPTLTDHMSCRLGKWYQQEETLSRFGHFQSFSKMMEPHEEVHKYALANLRYVDGADTVVENQKVIIDNFVKMESASDRLFDQMDEMIRESRHENAAGLKKL